MKTLCSVEKFVDNFIAKSLAVSSFLLNTHIARSIVKIFQNLYVAAVLLLGNAAVFLFKNIRFQNSKLESEIMKSVIMELINYQ